MSRRRVVVTDGGGSTAWSRDVSAWDATEKDVYGALRDALEAPRSDANRQAALATVVAVEGSAYRRPGAKMLVAGGTHLGAVTAGCLEGPIADLAHDVLATGRSMVETHDLTDDEGWGMGLGCNGVVTVLVEPVDGSLWPALDTVADRQSAAVCTVVGDSADGSVADGSVADGSVADGSVADGSVADAHGSGTASRTGPRVGARATVTDQGTLQAADRPALGDHVLDQLSDDVAACTARGAADVVTVETAAGGTVDVFVDCFRPVPELVVFGAGEDIAPVSRLASTAGFDVTVACPRGGLADPERFPGADDVRAVRAPDLGDVVEAPDHTYCVLMSHSFVDDQVALESLLATDVQYVGLMGPRKRFDQLRAELNANEVTLSETDRERIATPVGLDLGGGQPVEIAFSIVGEAIAARYGRPGGRLADHDEPIHPRPDR